MFVGNLCEKLYFCSKRFSMLTTTHKAVGLIQRKIIKYLDIVIMLLHTFHSDPITMRNHKEIKIQKEKFSHTQKGTKKKNLSIFKMRRRFFCYCRDENSISICTLTYTMTLITTIRNSFHFVN